MSIANDHHQRDDEPGGGFTGELERRAAERYHHRHPFNLLMHAGRLSRGDLRLWVANRYYYQTRIPIKDALVLAKAENTDFRRVWLERLRDHDGRDAEPGGLELWRRLGAACGLSAAELIGHDALLPGVREACDDYVSLVREADLLESVAASLTECFAPPLMKARIEAFEAHYPWVGEEALTYFRQRVERARQDGNFGLDFVLEHADTPELRERCLGAFEKKCDILWRMLDAVYVASRGPLRPRLDQRATLRELSRGAPEGVAVLLGPEKGLGLNASAHELLERCDGEATLDSIVADLAAAHREPKPALVLEIATFMGELERRRLLVFEGAPTE